MQPKTDTARLAYAVELFEEKLPGWWWSVGSCSVSRDAGCGPDRNGPDAWLLVHREFDNGFHFDDKTGTIESALTMVMTMALEARARYLDGISFV